MIFEGRALDQVLEGELAHLVGTHVAERQHLEFKASVDHRSPEGRMELLKDVVSLANGGGGYLIIGIRDDGEGRAQAFVSDGIDDAPRLVNSIRDLCLEHVMPRIGGLEVGKKNG